MREKVDWGRDPEVRRMRRLFSAMEETQWRMLKEASVSPHDPRLRQARDKARDLLWRAWPLVESRGMNAGEEGFARLYCCCLEWSLGGTGIEVTVERLPGDEHLMNLLREAVS